jgi:hypothetical protein
MAIHISDPSFGDMSTARLEFDAQFVDAAVAPAYNEYMVGKSASALFSRMQLYGPNQELLDDLRDNHQLDAVIRRVDDPDHASTVKNVADGSSIRYVKVLGEESGMFGPITFTQDATNFRKFVLTTSKSVGRTLNLASFGSGLYGSSVRAINGATVVETPGSMLFIVRILFNTTSLGAGGSIQLKMDNGGGDETAVVDYDNHGSKVLTWAAFVTACENAFAIVLDEELAADGNSAQILVGVQGTELTVSGTGVWDGAGGTGTVTDPTNAANLLDRFFIRRQTRDIAGATLGPSDVTLTYAYNAGAPPTLSIDDVMTVLYTNWTANVDADATQDATTFNISSPDTASGTVETVVYNLSSTNFRAVAPFNVIPTGEGTQEMGSITSIAYDSGTNVVNVTLNRATELDYSSVAVLIDLSTSIGYSDGIPMVCGPTVCASATSSPLYHFQVDLSPLSFMRTGKYFPLSALRGGGLRLVLEMARSVQCLKNVGHTNDTSAVTIYISNLQLSMQCINFDEVVQAQLESQLVEAGSLQFHTTKWIVDDGVLAANQSVITVSQPATSVRALFVVLLPNFNGNSSTPYNSYEFDPYLSTINSISGAQLNLGGRLYPSVAPIPIGPAANPASYEEFTLGNTSAFYATANPFGTFRRWNSPQMMDEFLRAIGSYGNKSFALSGVNQLTWNQNHYVPTAADSGVAPYGYFNGTGVPLGSFVFAFDLMPYHESGISGIGLNMLDKPVDIQVQFTTQSGNIIKTCPYVTALLVDSMAVFQADGTCKSAI